MNYILYITHYTLHITHYTLHITHYTLHITHYTLHIIHYTLYIMTEIRPFTQIYDFVSTHKYIMKQFCRIFKKDERITIREFLSNIQYEVESMVELEKTCQDDIENLFADIFDSVSKSVAISLNVDQSILLDMEAVENIRDIIYIYLIHNWVVKIVEFIISIENKLRIRKQDGNSYL